MIFSSAIWAGEPSGKLLLRERASRGCADPLRNDETRESVATVTKLTFHILLVEVNVDGKKIGLIVRPEKIHKDFIGKTWAQMKINVGSRMLVHWMPYSMSTRTVYLAHPGSEPARIIHVDSDNTLHLEVESIGQKIVLNSRPNNVMGYNGESLASLGLTTGTWVWLRWNPSTGIVESIVP